MPKDRPKDMDRTPEGAPVKHRPIKIKVIPRSNEAFVIVPLPTTEVNLTDSKKTNASNKTSKRLGMIRTDI